MIFYAIRFFKQNSSGLNTGISEKVKSLVFLVIMQSIFEMDAAQNICKASSKSQGWMKSTKAYEIPDYGCIVQSTTQQGSNVAETMVFVPYTKIVEDVNGGKKLIAIEQ